jgi:hypothetical protein
LGKLTVEGVTARLGLMLAPVVPGAGRVLPVTRTLVLSSSERVVVSSEGDWTER